MAGGHHPLYMLRDERRRLRGDLCTFMWLTTIWKTLCSMSASVSAISCTLDLRRASRGCALSLSNRASRRLELWRCSGAAQQPWRGGGCQVAHQPRDASLRVSREPFGSFWGVASCMIRASRHLFFISVHYVSNPTLDPQQLSVSTSSYKWELARIYWESGQLRYNLTWLPQTGYSCVRVDAKQQRYGRRQRGFRGG